MKHLSRAQAWWMRCPTRTLPAAHSDTRLLSNPHPTPNPPGRWTPPSLAASSWPWATSMSTCPSWPASSASSRLCATRCEDATAAGTPRGWCWQPQRDRCKAQGVAT